MKFYPISANWSKESLADLKRIGVLPSTVSAYANLADFHAQGGVTTPAEGNYYKPWRDEMANHMQHTPGFPPRVYWAWNGQTADIEVVASRPSAYSTAIINFYRSRKSQVPNVPVLVKVEMPNAEAARFNLATPSDSMRYDYPITFEFPQNIALRVNNGVLEAFDYQEFQRAHPWTPATAPAPPPQMKLDDGVLVATAKAIVNDETISIADRAKAVRALAGR